jgi:AraC-like DNA-binding protein
VKQCLTTSDKKPSERLEYWQEVVCKKYVSASAATDLENECFSGSLLSRELGPLVVAELTAPLHFWSRKPSHVRKDGQEVFIVSLIRRGGGELSQLGRTVRLSEGDLAIYDSGAPFDYALHASTQLIKVPKPLLESKLANARDFVGAKIERGNPLSAILGDLISTSLTIELSDDVGSVAAKRLSNAIVDLLVSVYDLKRESAPPPIRPLENVMRYVRANLDRDDLTPESLAAAGAVSVRTLNRLFGGMGTTPMRWVWSQRLEASRTSLAQGQVNSVTEAAFAHGFGELAHFSRRFKKAFGVAPHSMLKK